MKYNKERELCVLSINSLDKWIRSNGYAGWDPYDVKGMAWYTKIHYSDRKTFKILKRTVDVVSMIIPSYSRKIMNLKKQINPKAMGLLLSSYCNLYNITGDEQYLEFCIKISQWLENNANTDYKGKSWGYPFNWNSIIYIPAGTPSAIASVTVGDGFFELYKITNDNKYLEMCKSICVFLLEELNLYKESDDSICFSYTPIDNFQVHNINLLIAEFLVKIGYEFRLNEFIEIGERAARFSIKQQNPDGSIFYWSTQQDCNSPKHLDLYHSGFEIRALFGLYKKTGKKVYEESYTKYLDFFMKSYFDNKSIKLQPNRKFPVDIHACAEAINCLSILAYDNPKVAEKLNSIVSYTINNFQTKNGWFIYRIYKNIFKVKFPYLRWGQAWMMKALSEYLMIESNN